MKGLKKPCALMLGAILIVELIVVVMLSSVPALNISVSSQIQNATAKSIPECPPNFELKTRDLSVAAQWGENKVAIAGGHYHSLALFSNGTVWAEVKHFTIFAPMGSERKSEAVLAPIVSPILIAFSPLILVAVLIVVLGAIFIRREKREKTISYLRSQVYWQN